MIGHDYVALVRLSTKADQTLADVGDRCDQVAPASLPWLLETGRIARVAAPPAPAAQRER